MRSDDLAPLLVPPPDDDAVRFGQAVIVSYDPLTAASQVNYRGTILTDLPVLNGSEALLLKPGAVVGILKSRSQYFILGRITIPNTPEAATALDMVRIYSNATSLQAALADTAGAYVDATGGPQVNDVLISKSGRALVMLSADIYCQPLAANEGKTIAMSFAVSGATVRDANTQPNLRLTFVRDTSAGGTPVVQVAGSRVVLSENLNPGLHTFTAKYLSIANSGTVLVEDRNLTVIPF